MSHLHLIYGLLDDIAGSHAILYKIQIEKMNDSIAATAQNWQAYLQLKMISGQHKTRLLPVKRYGPLSVQRPFYPEQDVCHVYLLHPPGGVVGGDKLELQLDLEPESRALFTTPGATKYYLSAGLNAHIKQHIIVQQSAELEYLPQENIYFPGALVRAKTSLHVRHNSHAILWEKHCFGRPANNEFFSAGEIITELELYCEDKLLFTEKQRISAAEIRCVSGLRNHPVVGVLLVYSNRLTRNLIDSLRQVAPLGGISGITQPVEKILVARYMGSSTVDVNNYFIKLLELLRPAILHKEMCCPRIWAT